ncbi:hypothetical protein CYMTET_35365 [Cymbomonas tetramitiformis]|uniref:Uncharacterized protein n=1 Tax=Cymbomonas tetramitiformis TaxID=36881 RepID=A0AAE0KP10_9CHLO|nr:hypothetical protein CYMTET_35365 [Cymbomonas tetramitiformis]
MNTSTTEDMVPADPRIAGRRGEQQGWRPTSVPSIGLRLFEEHIADTGGGEAHSPDAVQVIEIENVKTAWRKWYQKDPWALPEGPVLHTIFGTGGDPAVQHDREWNLVPDPPAVDYQ